MPFQKAKDLYALAKASPGYQNMLNSVRSARRTAGEVGGQVGGGAAVGALSGGVSNYLAEGDMDHALSGAFTGAMIGGVGGRVLRNANPLAQLAVIGGVPAALAQVKDRSAVANLYKPKSTDMISGLYSAERAFEENSPEWQQYYEENPEAYMARYGQQKAAAFETDVSGPGSAVDLDYYRLHKELREKGYTRQEREKILRNDFGTQLKDMARGAGYGIGGGALGALAGYGLSNALDIDDIRLKGNITAMAGAAGLGLGGLLAKRDIYNLDQEAIEDAENLDVKKEANWKMQALAGAGLLGAGTLGGALLTGESKEDFVDRLDREQEIQTLRDMGQISDAQYNNWLIERRDEGELALPEDRYDIATPLSRVDSFKEASMSLNDITAMEAMSGVNVGRTRTKVGMIIDSNGVYTLYDESGKYTYGDFTKLSEAQEHAEKVAKYYAEGDKIMRRRWFGLRGPQQIATVGEGGQMTFNRGVQNVGAYKDQMNSRGFGNRRHYAGFDRAAESATANVKKTTDAFQKGVTQGAANANPQLAETARARQQQIVHHRRQLGDLRGQNAQMARDSTRSQQAAAEELKRTQQAAAAELQATQQRGAQGIQAAQAEGKRGVQAAQAERDAVAKSLKNWKRGTGIAGTALAAGAAGYGLYNWWNQKKDPTFAQRAAGVAKDTISALKPYQKDLGMINQFAQTAMNVGKAAGTTAYNPYSAQGAQYQQMPRYGGGYGGGYNRGY